MCQPFSGDPCPGAAVGNDGADPIAQKAGFIPEVFNVDASVQIRHASAEALVFGSDPESIRTVEENRLDIAHSDDRHDLRKATADRHAEKTPLSSDPNAVHRADGHESNALRPGATAHAAEETIRRKL